LLTREGLPEDIAAEPLKMLTPQRPLAQSLVLGAVVIGIMAVGAVVLYAATGWLWLIVHQGLH
jgi:multisubunit Na+/H+ antiporter MnhC subunit